MSVDNVGDYFLTAYLHNCDKLKEKSIRLIRNHWDTLKHSEAMSVVFKQYPSSMFDILDVVITETDRKIRDLEVIKQARQHKKQMRKRNLSTPVEEDGSEADDIFDKTWWKKNGF